MPNDVAVVIVTFNSAHVIDALLDSLPAALSGVTAEIVVVDNGSTDETLTTLDRRSECRVIRSTNIGYSGGVNLGVRSTTAPAILVLNPDTRLNPGSVASLLAALHLPGTAVAVPQIRTASGHLYQSLRREPTLRRALGLTATKLPAFSEYVSQTDAYDRPSTVDWALGAVLLMSRAGYDAVGPWDESYFLYSEETDYCLRARDIGLVTRYEPTAVAVHIGAQSGQNLNTHAMQIINRVRLYRRRHGRFQSWAYFALTVLSESSWIPRGGGQRSWFAVKCLLRPSLRPRELGCNDRLLPT